MVRLSPSRGSVEVGTGQEFRGSHPVAPPFFMPVMLSAAGPVSASSFSPTPVAALILGFEVFIFTPLKPIVCGVSLSAWPER